MRLPLTLLLAFPVVLLAGCAQDAADEQTSLPATQPAEKSLYERLGGEASIRAVVADIAARAADDPRVNFARKGMPNEWNATPQNLAHMKEMFTQFLIQASGGPSHYEGREMKSLHRGMRISNPEFNAFLEDVKLTLGRYTVAPREQQELMRILESQRGNIVETP